MGERGKQDRPVSAHNLPMALSAPRPAAGFSRNRPGAAFLAQLLANRSAGSADNATPSGPRATFANSAYRSAEISDVKRMPMGYRKAMSA